MQEMVFLSTSYLVLNLLLCSTIFSAVVELIDFGSVWLLGTGITCNKSYMQILLLLQVVLVIGVAVAE